MNQVAVHFSCPRMASLLPVMEKRGRAASMRCRDDGGPDVHSGKGWGGVGDLTPQARRPGVPPLRDGPSEHVRTCASRHVRRNASSQHMESDGRTTQPGRRASRSKGAAKGRLPHPLLFQRARAQNQLTEQKTPITSNGQAKRRCSWAGARACRICASTKWPMRALAITGMVTAALIDLIICGRRERREGAGEALEAPFRGTLNIGK